MKYSVFFLSMILFSFPLYAENQPTQNTVQMNIKSLDEAWMNREDLQGENSILNFVQSNPPLPEDFEVCWRVSRLVYFIGNFGLGRKLTQDEHLQVFELGFKAGAIAKKLEPKKVEGYYWYAINLGEYSLNKGLLTALTTATEARDALLEAAKIDPHYHWAGPYRILGRYYQDLPSTISFGDKKIARKYFEKAIETAPNFRVNTEYLGILEKDKETKSKLFEIAQQKADVDGKIEENLYKENIAADLKALGIKNKDLK